MKTESIQVTAEKYGLPKCVRYMVNSTLEFLEVLHTVNSIIGSVVDRSEIEAIQRSANFSIIPLPHSQTKFIACLELPLGLLGATGARRPLQLDFSEFDEPNAKVPIMRNPPMVIATYEVRTLFDVNYAIHSFEASVAPYIPQAQWLRVKRSLAIAVTASESAGAPMLMVVSVEANPALPIAKTGA